MPCLNKDYSLSVINVFTVVISKSCLSASFTSVFFKKLPQFLCLLPAFPFSQQLEPLLKTKQKKATNFKIIEATLVHNTTVIVVALPYLQLSFNL